MRVRFFIFGGWHNVELFATRSASRGELYQPVSQLWQQNVEVARVYLVPMPWVYAYCAQHATTVSALKMQSFECIAVRQYVEACIPVVLATARWGTRAKDFSDARLHRFGEGNREVDGKMPLTRTIIAPLSPTVIRVFRARMDEFRELLASAEGGSRNLLVFKRILAIDWDATFAGKTESPNGRWLY